MEYSGTLDGPIVPYMRLPNKMRWSKAGKRYHASQNRVIAHMQAVAVGYPIGGGTWRRVPNVFRFDLTIIVPPTKAGEIPKNRGDADNYLKAFLDAAQRGKIVDGDDLSRYRGGVLDVQMGNAWRFEWGLYEVLK